MLEGMKKEPGAGHFGGRAVQLVLHLARAGGHIEPALPTEEIPCRIAAKYGFLQEIQTFSEGSVYQLASRYEKLLKKIVEEDQEAERRTLLARAEPAQARKLPTFE